jgi:hypothetical protein
MKGGARMNQYYNEPEELGRIPSAPKEKIS